MMCLSLLLVGCSANKNTNYTPEVPFKKGAPVVYIHPFSYDSQQAAIGVLPFVVPPNVSNQQSLSVSALFKDVFLGKRTFKVVKQITEPYGDLDEAIDLGKESEVDLVLAGRINYALAGTDFGGSRVEVSVRLLDVHSGNTVWYMEQTMDQGMDYPAPGFFNRLFGVFSLLPTQQPTGAPTVPNMLAKIAFDMADVMAGAKTVKK